MILSIKNIISCFKYRKNKRFLFRNENMLRKYNSEVVIIRNYPESQKCSIKFSDGLTMTAHYNELFYLD